MAGCQGTVNMGKDPHDAFRSNDHLREAEVEPADAHESSRTSGREAGGNEGSSAQMSMATTSPTPTVPRITTTKEITTMRTQINLKQWRILQGSIPVQRNADPGSTVVQMLNEGEIVEQVAPAFTLSNGIIRVQIRHPSGPKYPMPIGWVTQDSTAVGGSRFLESESEQDQRY